MTAEANATQLEILVDIQTRLRGLEQRPLFRRSHIPVHDDDFREACRFVGVSVTALRAKCCESWLVDKRKHVAELLNDQGYNLSQIDRVLHRQRGCASHLLGLKKRRCV